MPYVPSFCSCDRNHGGFDCSIEIVSHQGECSLLISIIYFVVLTIFTLIFFVIIEVDHSLLCHVIFIWFPCYMYLIHTNFLHSGNIHLVGKLSTFQIYISSITTFFMPWHLYLLLLFVSSILKCCLIHHLLNMWLIT